MNALKNCLIFAAGAVVGSVITYFVTKKKLDEKHEAELHQMDEYYLGAMQNLTSSTAEALNKVCEASVPKDTLNEEPVVVEKHIVNEQPGPKERSLVRDKVDYTSFYKRAESENPKEDSDYYEEAVPKQKEGETKYKPKIIKQEEFGNDPEIHNTVDLFYYQGDGVLTLGDEQNEESFIDFREVEDLIGSALYKYGFDTNSEDVIYVRNKSRGCDYRIIKRYYSYSED